MDEEAVTTAENAAAETTAASAPEPAWWENIDWAETLTLLQNWVTEYGLRILIAILIFVVGRWIAKLITGVVKKLLTARSVDPTLVGFLSAITFAILMVAVILAAIDAVGIQTTSLVAVIGAAGLAIGLALQGSLANFAAGVMLIGFRPFKAGDFINAGGVSGIVEDIGIFTTQLKTPDNKAIILPNGKVTSDAITNFSAKPNRRMDLVFGVSYSDDLKVAKEVCLKVIEADERILKDPAPTVGVLELGDNSVNLAVRPWVNVPDYWDVFFHLNETIKVELEKAGCSIPFPQRDLHIIDGWGGKDGDSEKVS